MTSKLDWGILGCGRIAGAFAKGLAASHNGRLVAVASRSSDKARKFAEENGGPVAHGSYEALLADATVQAVYVATPHPLHAEWTVKAAEAGKHVLCEKPLGINAAQAESMIEAALRHDVFLMEAIMYRCHPQTAKVVDLVRDGAIGQVRFIQAAFSFNAGFNPDSRLFSQALCGGGILDVGCYPVSWARLIAGAAAGRGFLDPIQVSGSGHLGKTGVDEWAAAVMKFENEIVAEVATGVSVQQENVARIYGTSGWIVVPSPWVPAREGGTVSFSLWRGGKEETVELKAAHLYSYEADVVAANLEKRQAPSPAMSWDDTLGNLRALDRWRQASGLEYEAEKLDGGWPTVHRRPLAVRAKASIPRGRLPGLAKDVSRLIMGQDNQRSLPPASALWDEFFERGGNCVDVAYVYGGGTCEAVLGKWIANRGIRDRLAIIGKGAHTPFCNPEDLSRQLMESLDRLGTDFVDIYLMHRDNPQVPVGEFVDVLNAHQAAGRMTVFGVSNWRRERIEAFNADARARGKAGIAMVSNNFSLARMVDPVWTDCVASSLPEFKQWHISGQMPLLAWSSQARGFFTERSAPDRKDERDLVRCWYAPDNFERKARAEQLAIEKAVTPIQIALAYVLCQPFPIFALIGPRCLAELRTSCEALPIRLTPGELAWLNLEADRR